MEENARAALDQAEYGARHNALVARYEAAKEKADAAQGEKRQRELRRVQADAFFFEITEREGPLTEFEEELWNCTVESVLVLVGGGFRVRFRDRMEETVS